MKSTNIVRYACGTLLAITFLTACSSSKDTVVNKPGIFYAITGNDLTDTSWLFGTYHTVKSSYLDNWLAVKAAFKKSKGVVVEATMDSADIAAFLPLTFMPYNTLDTLFDKPFLDSLDRELLAKTGTGIKQYNHHKPMQIVLLLSAANSMQANNGQLQQYTGLPLDLGFIQDGRSNGKEVTPLETLQSQADLLMNTLSEKEQATTLQYMLRNNEQINHLTSKISTYWLRQELDSITHLITNVSLVKATGGSELFYLLNDNRNNAWMKKLPALLAQQSQFIAVGALHLAGPSGLVNQLRKLGYTVTPIK